MSLRRGQLGPAAVGGGTGALERAPQRGQADWPRPLRRRTNRSGGRRSRGSGGAAEGRGGAGGGSGGRGVCFTGEPHHAAEIRAFENGGTAVRRRTWRLLRVVMDVHRLYADAARSGHPRQTHVGAAEKAGARASETPRSS